MSGTGCDFEFDALEEARHYRAAVAREFLPWLRGRVVEIGAGAGQMTAHLAAAPAIVEITGVEPDARFHKAFLHRNPRARLFAGTSDDLPSRPGWDALAAVNVLEHIDDDAAELRRWRSLLADRSGVACVFVPARPELFAPIDRSFGHHRRYTKQVLKAKLEAAGFALEQLMYFNFVGYFAWWLHFRTLRRRRFNPKSVRRFDSLVFPVTNWFETRVARPPFGQSLIAVGRVMN